MTCTKAAALLMVWTLAFALNIKESNDMPSIDVSESRGYQHASVAVAKKHPSPLSNEKVDASFVSYRCRKLTPSCQMCGQQGLPDAICGKYLLQR